ncbi:hypothetical protein NHX12_002420 [Muraenolepis orangiensis]|uniref:PH domain-containing protein n=1 Tax=Muraenolepis orangiensis TaxID=630683 RepID=A0A9Q0DYF5_9TELE|nr:hypothetical protein NHX12_002420 [Muraenolepis orangiensis]
MRSYIYKHSSVIGSQAEHGGMRTYFFSADTQEDQSSWLGAMNQAAQMQNQADAVDRPTERLLPLDPRQVLLEPIGQGPPGHPGTLLRDAGPVDVGPASASAPGSEAPPRAASALPRGSATRNGLSASATPSPILEPNGIGAGTYQRSPSPPRPHAPPQGGGPRRSAQEGVEHWVHVQRAEVKGPPSRENTLPRRSPSSLPKFSSHGEKRYQTLPKTPRLSPSSPAAARAGEYKYAQDRLNHFRLAPEPGGGAGAVGGGPSAVGGGPGAVGGAGGPVYHLYEWQQRHQYRHGSPTAPLYTPAPDYPYGPRPPSAFSPPRPSDGHPRCISVPPSPDDLRPPGTPARRPHMPAERVTVRPAAGRSVPDGPFAASPRRAKSQLLKASTMDRRSMPVSGYITHTVSAPSLHGKTPEELTLLLIQLRRHQAMMASARQHTLMQLQHLNGSESDDTYMQLKKDLDYLDLKSLTWVQTRCAPHLGPDQVCYERTPPHLGPDQASALHLKKVAIDSQVVGSHLLKECGKAVKVAESDVDDKTLKELESRISTLKDDKTLSVWPPTWPCPLHLGPPPPHGPAPSHMTPPPPPWPRPLHHGPAPSTLALPPPPWPCPLHHGPAPSTMALPPLTWPCPLPLGPAPSHMALPLHLALPPPPWPCPSTWPCPLPLDPAPSHMALSPPTWPCPLPLGPAPSHMALSPPTWPCPLPLGPAPSHMALPPPTWPCPLPHDPAPSTMALPPPPWPRPFHHGPAPSTMALPPLPWPCPLPLGPAPSTVALPPLTWPCPLPLGPAPSHMALPLHLALPPLTWPCPLPHGPAPPLGPAPSPLALPPPTWPCPLPHGPAPPLGPAPSHMALPPPTWPCPLPHGPAPPLGPAPSHMALPPPTWPCPSTWPCPLPHGTAPSHMALPLHLALPPPTWPCPLPHGPAPPLGPAPSHMALPPPTWPCPSHMALPLHLALPPPTWPCPSHMALPLHLALPPPPWPCPLPLGPDQLERVLDLSRQQMEQYQEQPAHSHKIAYQQRLLQEDLVTIRAHISRVSTAHMNHSTTPQQEKTELQRELWRVEDVMAGLSGSKANYKITIDSVQNPERKLAPSVSEGMLIQPPSRASTPGSLSLPHGTTWGAREDTPPAVPPLPRDASSVVRHTSVRGLKRQSDERKRDRESGHYAANGDYKVELRSYLSEPELPVMESPVLDVPSFSDKGLFSSGLNQSSSISSYVTLRRGLGGGQADRERPRSALDHLYAPPPSAQAPPCPTRGRMSAQEQLERMKRHQRALVRERQRNLSQGAGPYSFGPAPGPAQRCSSTSRLPSSSGPEQPPSVRYPDTTHGPRRDRRRGRYATLQPSTT